MQQFVRNLSERTDGRTVATDACAYDSSSADSVKQS